MEIARLFSWQRVIPQFQSGKGTGHLRLLTLTQFGDSTIALYAAPRDRSTTGPPHPPYLEQIARREKRNTQHCACEIKIMADAVLPSPTHKCKSMKCIRDIARTTRLRHPAPSTCRSDPTFLVFENNTIEPNNSIEDGANATKDLISVPLMTRKVRTNGIAFPMLAQTFPIRGINW